MDHGQGLEPQEVHLQEADFPERLHRVLRDRFLFLVEGQRDDLGQDLLADHHAGRVRTGVTVEPLEYDAVVQNAFAAVLRFVSLLELGV